MNQNQAAYQAGRVIMNNPDVISLAGTVALGYQSVTYFQQSPLILGMLGGTIIGAMGIGMGYYCLKFAALRTFSYLDLKKINPKREAYPLGHSERIIIDDAEGLEFLLSKTKEREEIEWGTLLKVHDNKDRAIVDEILDISKGKELGLIGEGTESSMRLKVNRANNEGYNGCHHYHPEVISQKVGAMNFSISPIDRYKPLNWINLLTFNLPTGPEIVGFNRQYTYIPIDRSKRELVRATPKQIMEYLGASK